MIPSPTYHASVVEFVILLVLLDVLIHCTVEGQNIDLISVDELQAVEDRFVAPRPPAGRRCEVDDGDALIMTH